VAFLSDIVSLKCPVCREGVVFRGPYSMNETCPKCSIRFERENGYFMGAMWIAYALGVFSIIPTVIVLVQYYEAEMPVVIGIPILQLILLQPFIYVYSRMIWLYIDRGANRKDWQ
jgi:uncharacterized protein (DUF983 family)